MIFSKSISSGLIKKIPLLSFIRNHLGWYFLTMPCLVGYLNLSFYAFQHNFFLRVDFSILLLMAAFGIMLSLIFLGFFHLTLLLLKNSILPAVELKRCKNLVVAAAFSYLWGVTPDLTVKTFGVGGYTGTIVFKPTAAQAIPNLSSMIDQSTHTADNLNILWSHGKQLVVKIPDEYYPNNVVNIESKWIENVLKSNPRSEKRNSSRVTSHGE